MGSDQSSQLPAGVPDTPRSSPHYLGDRPSAALMPVLRENPSKESTPKHDIIVVADGQVSIKDPDPELTRLSTIPTFFPIMRGSLNLPNISWDIGVLEKLDSKHLLNLCLRYQDHLKQLAESVAFDQNALCIRIKEIDCFIMKLMNIMTEQQKRYAKYAEQFQRTSETVLVLNRVKDAISDIVPKIETLNHMLPPDEQLEPLTIKSFLQK